ncbi:GNAT family N-acetyltransferase [Kitasatospora sp. NPDC056076]|uniref:GNAT family N-acetyltransferase n=1 Tax=Kitasatospora sp. NPDC056076 TaxID=3345703 RepID=UPI0035DBEE80
MKSAYLNHQGRAYASLRYEPETPSVVILAEIRVDPDFQGRGWGSELLSEIAAAADREGVALMLSVEPGPFGLDRQQLVAWYSRYGWDPVTSAETGKVEPDVLCRLPQVST